MRRKKILFSEAANTEASYVVEAWPRHLFPSVSILTDFSQKNKTDKYHPQSSKILHQNKVRTYMQAPNLTQKSCVCKGYELEILVSLLLFKDISFSLFIFDRNMSHQFSFISRSYRFSTNLPQWKHLYFIITNSIGSSLSYTLLNFIT